MDRLSYTRVIAMLAVGWALAGSSACGRRKAIGGADAAGDATDAAEKEDAAADAASEAQADVAPDVHVVFGARSLALGRYHSCAVLDDGRAKCWGLGDDGVLGQGDKRNRGAAPSEMGDALPAIDLGTGRTALQLAAGDRETCAVLDDHSVKCWGLRLLQSGAPTTPDAFGDEPGEMGDNLPTLDLGPGRTAKQVALGFYTLCVVRDDESLRCWERGVAGPHDLVLPAGRRVVDTAQTGGLALLLDDGSVWKVMTGTETPHDQSLQPIVVGAGAPATSLSGARLRDLCTVVGAGKPACANPDTQRYLDTVRGPLRAITQLEGLLPCVLRTDGSVTCFGRTQWNEAWAELEHEDHGLVRVKLPLPAVEVRGGSQFLCARLVDHSVRCWADVSARWATVGATFPDPPELGANARWLPVDLGTPQPAP